MGAGKPAASLDARKIRISKSVSQMSLDAQNPTSQVTPDMLDPAPQTAPLSQDPTTQMPSNTLDPTPQTATLSQDPTPQMPSGMLDPAPQTAPLSQNPAPQTPSLSQEQPDTQEAPDPAAKIADDLILDRGRITVTGNELHLNRKHYVKRSGKQKFRAEKKPALIPLDTILDVSLEHYKYGGRMFLSLLLLLCFSAAAFYSARWGHDTYHGLNTPYRAQELAAQESIMAVIDGDGPQQLLQYRNSLEENRSAAEALSEHLAGLEAQQTLERVDAISTSDTLDLDTFFNRELFSRAYQEYLQELLDAFKADNALHSWLYSYYKTTKAYGGNSFLDTDLWIYSGAGESGFSPGLDSAAALMQDQYDLDLYEHMLYTGRIYITGADLMKVVLSLPRYTVDGAVFAKACGGVPEASEMSVPGWTGSRYEEFWLYGADYYGVDSPMWLDYGFSAKDFTLDWNALMDESAYYDAYGNFMDRIAPGLPRFEMASYQADDGAYGGMGFRLKGMEPSFSDLIVSYAESHPEYIDELTADKAYSQLLATSVDREIAETEKQLEKLETELPDLEERERELTLLLADADTHRNTYALLLTDIEQHTRKLTCLLLFFVGTALLCLFGALTCLCRFFGFLKRPRQLFLIRRQDQEYGFCMRRFPEAQIQSLQSRLSEQINDRNMEP